MTTRSYRAAVALFVLIVAASAGARAQGTDAGAGDAGRGQALYNRDGCFECHGYVGQGSPVSGPRVAPMRMPISAFIGQMRKPGGEMPPYEASVLSDQEASDIYAFLKSIPAPTQAAKDLPLLNR